MNEELLNMSENQLSKLWNEIDFAKAERELLWMQQRLTKAVFRGDELRCEQIQREIVTSMPARILAVRHVSNNTYSVGSDGVVWRSAADKMQAVMKLNERAKIAPRRIVQINKGTKKREIQIGTMRERAREKLYAYALSPIAEAHGDRKSFAFRKGRSHKDADAYIREALKGVNAPEYILIADVEMYYESINHNWLLKHIPMDKQALRDFLKAEYVKNGKLFQQDMGMSLGSSISCILGNMVLDGLQKYLYIGLHGNREIDYMGGNMIRFADDICVTARSKSQAEKIRSLVQKFLEKRGLSLHQRKTKILHIKEGFDFLAHHYECANGSVYVTPSEKAVKIAKENLVTYISSYHGSQRRLIETINQKLIGFATYHKNTHARRAFREIDEMVTKELYKLCKKKHPDWKKDKIYKNYFYLDDKDRYCYTISGHMKYQVRRLEDTTFVPHKRVGTKFNPHLDQAYLKKRETQRSVWNVTGRYQQIWNRQEGVCAVCNLPILADQYREVQEKAGTKGSNISQLEYIHSNCKNKAVYDKEEICTLHQVERDVKGMKGDIIKMLNDGCLPEDAYYELRQFIGYLKEKYGLGN